MGIFSFFIGKSKPKVVPPIDNPIKVDLHSHYLPGIDDGCKEIGESIAILKKLQELGYRKAITTPHVMGDFYKNSPEIINAKLAEVHAAMKEEGLTIVLEAAAEYYVDEWMAEKIKNRELLTFGDSYLLIETGFIDPPGNLLQTIFDLKMAGYKPVLAHPERYQYFIPGKDIYTQLKDSGVLFQMNLLSIIGYYSKPVQKIAEHLIEHRMVNFIGGDTHNLKHLFHVQEEACRHPLYAKVTQLPLLNNSL
ncbi:MAG: capsular biosynthesis protein [Flavobacteriaceae bacterium]|nr:capsular biosynthesis protein [Flavobacteriaceae bacterium]